MTNLSGKQNSYRPPIIFGNSHTFLSIFILSTAVFLYQIALTRIFPIMHFYHFSFIIIALALLGGGASGTLLAIRPGISQQDSHHLSLTLSMACAISILGSFILINRLPFDAYALAIDRSQFLILFLHFIALASPFFCVGLLVSALMKKSATHSHVVYATNLVGSASGCLLAPLLLNMVGGVGVVLISTCMASLSAILAIADLKKYASQNVIGNFKKYLPTLLACLMVLVFSLNQSLLIISGKPAHPLLEIQISPYKALSYALQYPGARITDSRWNAFSRVDIVESEGIRSLPGLSFLYNGIIQAEAGILVDGADMHALLSPDTDPSVFAYLPQSLAYRLRRNAQVLIIGSHAGQEVLTARTSGASKIMAVEPNRLLVQAAQKIYSLPEVHVVTESPRVFLRRTDLTFDVMVLPLINSYYPVTSGAYSLGEDYRYTLESFQEAISHLDQDGILVINRWLQMPPSEFLRVFILAAEALNQLGLDGTSRLAAIRGYNMGTLFISPLPFSKADMVIIRQFAEKYAFDLVHLPGLQAHEANRFNILQEDIYYENFKSYLESENRTAWFKEYPYRVDPPSDDHPFFMHFYKWSQIDQIMQAYGKTWQPFGGAGILVMFFLLASMLLLSVGLVLLPLILNAARRIQPFRKVSQFARKFFVMGFFLAIGIGFMTVEIPLIQHFILYLGQPEYAMSVVLFTLLFASGIGSRASRQVPIYCLLLLAILVLLMPIWLTAIFNLSMGWSFTLRILVAILCLSPIGFLMGLPLAKGMAVLHQIEPQLVAWAWAINGSASVVASVFAALVALSFNFTFVLLIGATCYLLAYVFLLRISHVGHSRLEQG